MKTITFIKNGLLTAFIVLISLSTTLAVELTVNFKNSFGDPIEGAEVKFNDLINSGWQVLGFTDVNGQVIGEIETNQWHHTPRIRVYYSSTFEQKSIDLDVSTVLNFQTTLVTMKLLSSLGNEIPSQDAWYGTGGWGQFGDGITTESIEMLNKEYNFRVQYNDVTAIKIQDISIDPIVVFNTVNVKLYFSGLIELWKPGWVNFDGDEEFLPGLYGFSFSGIGYSNVDVNIDVSDLDIEKTVEYIQFKSSLGIGIEGAATQFNASPWQAGNNTNVNGSCVNFVDGYVENVTTRLYYGGTYEDIDQDIIADSFVDFNTVLVSMDLKDSEGSPLASSDAKYYANGWQQFGDGVTSESIELLAQDYNFRVSYANGSESKHQDVGVDADVAFETVAVTTNLFDSNGNDLESEDVTYSSDGSTWMQFGDGITSETIELLADDYTFRMAYAAATIDKDQNVGDDAVVNFATVPVTMNVYDENANVLEGTDAMYNFSGWNVFGAGTTPEVVELLPVVYDFKATYDGDEMTANQNTAFNPNVSFTVVSAPALVVIEENEDSFLDDDEMMENEVVYEKSANEANLESITNLNANAYPNPFSESVTVSYKVEADSKVNISIYNINGTLITTLVDENMYKGSYEVKWNADNANGNIIPNGTYFYKITIGNKVESNALILQR